MSDSDESVAPLIPLRPDELVAKIDAANDQLHAMEERERRVANQQTAAKRDMDEALATQRRMLDRHRAAKREAHQQEAALNRQRQKWERQLEAAQGDERRRRDVSAAERAMEAVSVPGDGVLEKLEGGTLGTAWRKRWVIATAGGGAVRCWKSLTRPNLSESAPYLTLPLVEDECDLSYFSAFECARFKRPFALTLETRLRGGGRRVVSFAFDSRRTMQRWSLALLDGCKQGDGGGGGGAKTTSLFRAAQQGDVGAIAALLQGAGADVNATNAYQMTPLHYAVKAAVNEAAAAASSSPPSKLFGRLSDAIALLLRKGADPLCACNTGKTALDMAAGHRVVEVMLKRNLDRVKNQGRWRAATRKVHAALAAY